jgi:phage FluMu protein Com
MKNSLLLEYRCTCHNLLFKGIVSSRSSLEIKCKKCSKITFLNSNIDNNIDDDHFTLALDKSGKIIDFSISSSKILEYSATELKKMSIYDIAPNARNSDFLKMWETLNKLPDQTFNSDSIFKTKNSKDLYLRSKFKLHSINRKPCVVVFYKVIDRNNEDKIIFDLTKIKLSNYVAELNTEGRILYVSQELIAQINKPTVEILGKEIFDFLPNKLAAGLKKDFQKINKIQKTIYIPNEMIFGKKNKFDILLTPIYHENNQIKGLKMLIKPIKK